MNNLPTEAFQKNADYVLSESIGWLLRNTVNLMSQAVEKKMESSGLTNAQWRPMLRLYLGDASTVAELARCCSHDTGGMTRLLDRIEAKGLCERQRSEADRRIVNIALTQEGREVAKNIPAQLKEVQQDALKGFSPEEIAQFKGYLHRILATLQENTTTDTSTPSS